jgi:prepilin-type processing-associated H-X9-DG protein
MQYEAEYKTYPPAYTTDADGKPLHSWRTLLLPYLEQQVLYNTIDFSKPWDDPANAIAYNSPIPSLRCSGIRSDIPATHTTYVAVLAENSLVRLGGNLRALDVKDGLTNTIALYEVDADMAVPWMNPIDPTFEQFLAARKNSNPKHASHVGGRNYSLADGSVRFLPESIDEKWLRALATVDGREIIPVEVFQ